MTLTAEQNEILDLRDRVFELEEALRGLTCAMSDDPMRFPPEWRLSPRESRALFVLVSCSKDVSISTLLPAVSKSKTTDWRVVRVVMFELRRSLKPFGIKIDTVKGGGYALTEESKKHINSALVKSIPASAGVCV